MPNKEPPDAGPRTRSKELCISMGLRPLRVQSAPLDEPTGQSINRGSRSAGAARESHHIKFPAFLECSARISLSSQSQLAQHTHAEADSLQGSPMRGAELQNSPGGGVVEAPARAVAIAKCQNQVHEACCAADGCDDDEQSSSTCSECSGSQHHTPSCDGRDEAIAAWLADHGQVTLADVEEAVTPAKRFDPEPSSPSHGSLESWHGLDAAPPPPATAAGVSAAAGNAPAFPYIVQPFDQAHGGGPHGAVQALNSRLQHGVLDAHARQRAMRRDMRAVTSERQTNNALAPAQPAPQHAVFPGPPFALGPAAAAEAAQDQAGALPPAATGARPTKMMRLGPPLQGAQQTIPTACGKGRIRIARMVF
ncbi:hypothetical protein WJX74_006444 [Apatococcus lobatus]|uniref:Uncharacterized protein n=1 Tax=Apatococcus lobatus TaxID=904363 RepID=A0AAW1RSE6_9CHLO